MNERKNEANDDKKELKSIGLFRWRFKTQVLFMMVMLLAAGTIINITESASAGWVGNSRYWTTFHIFVSLIVFFM